MNKTFELALKQVIEEVGRPDRQTDIIRAIVSAAEEIHAMSDFAKDVVTRKFSRDSAAFSAKIPLRYLPDAASILRVEDQEGRKVNFRQDQENLAVYAAGTTLNYMFTTLFITIKIRNDISPTQVSWVFTPGISWELLIETAKRNFFSTMRDPRANDCRARIGSVNQFDSLAFRFLKSTPKVLE